VIAYFLCDPQCVDSPQSNRQPVKLNLLTCQVKPSSEDRKCFDLISREFHWISRLHVSVRQSGNSCCFLNIKDK